MTDDLTLNMDAYLPLRDVVFNTLREAILKGDLKPGERLMELQLAAKLGVSRTPIREAIRMLEQEGLAVTMPRKGAEVAKMTLKDMEDVLEILRINLVGVIPEDQSVLRASNQGEPVILDDASDAGKAYADTVERLLGEERPFRFIEEEKKGFPKRLFGG